MTPARPLRPKRSAIGLLDLIYHTTVREVRKSHSNALIGLLLSVLQSIIYIAAFYAMFTLVGVRGSGIAGADFLLYLMSGIFLFLTHTKAMTAVIASEGPTSPIMQHAPLNTIVTIAAAALGALYMQMLSLVLVLFLYHALITPIVIDDPFGAMGMFLLAWFSGAAIGMVFLALKPWLPDIVKLGSSTYARANMVASGKMFVANALPALWLGLFSWNPLFHAIDQCRGYLFLNYTPRNTDVGYPMWLSLALLMIGLMGEFYTRRHTSLSWGAKR